MDWEEKIKEGMRLIKEGCEKQGCWVDNCFECPFYDYCNTLEDNGGVAPSEWELKK